MTYISAAMSKDRSEVMVWERTESGARILRNYDAPYYFYLQHDKGTYRDINGRPLKRMVYDNSFEFYETKEEFKSDGVKLYESDINPIYKVLSEQYYNKPVGTLNYTFYDIEVDYKPELGFPKPESCYAPVNAISLYHSRNDEMVLLVVPPDNGKWTAKDIPEDCRTMARIVVCKTETELLMHFFKEIEESDIISGWNSAGFDDPYMYFRTQKVLGDGWANKLGFEGAPKPKIKEVEIFVGQKQTRVEIYGRVFIDYLELFKKFETTTRPSFTLDAISEEVLPEEKKLEFDCSLYELYYDHFPDFCRYNVRDTVVLKGFERKLGYMGIAIMTYHSATALMNDVLGTVRIVESTIINKCHYVLNTIVPDAKEAILSSDKFAGALVIDPNPGMHDWTVSTDFSSLYPSNIRTLNISPEKIVGQFHNDFVAFEEISARSNKPLTIIYEDSKSETHTAKEWASILPSRKYSISGFGTVFDQNESGFIPNILEEWYSERKKYKKLSSNAKKSMKAMEDEKGISNFTSEDKEQYDKYKLEYEYYHRLQFIKKILLNSTYGCLGNKFFKFYDIRMAESTTRSGREALLHMLRTVANILAGKALFQWSSAQNLPEKFRFPYEDIIYGDTDSCYFSLAKCGVKTADEAYELAKLIEGKINEEMSKFVREYFFCNDGFDSILKAELDVIADKSVFIKKKYYVMHLLYNEGVKTDKMKVMGLQIKKTTIPKHISKVLTKFVEELLKGKEWSILSREIVAYKDVLMNEATTQIGLPKGIKKIEEYTRLYNLNTPGLRLPGHVAAAMFYNKCLEVYGDKESAPISSGMKIKTYYLKKKFGYFKSIALPTDMKYPPAWFKENFEHLVDRRGQIDRLVDKPLDSVLNAIGKVSPTKKTILIDELFEY